MRPTAGGRYFAANEERLRLVAEEAPLKADVTALDDALDRRRQARAHLAEIEQPEQQVTRRDAIIAAEIAYGVANRIATPSRSPKTRL